MIGIKVCRGGSFPGECSELDPNLNWGDDISDVLLINEGIALERGRVEIDKGYTNRIDSSVSIAPLTFISPGDLVGVDENGSLKSGMLKNIKLSLKKTADSFSTSAVLVIERNV